MILLDNLLFIFQLAFCYLANLFFNFQQAFDNFSKFQQSHSTLSVETVFSQKIKFFYVSLFHLLSDLLFTSGCFVMFCFASLKSFKLFESNSLFFCHKLTLHTHSPYLNVLDKLFDAYELYFTFTFSYQH